MNYKQQNISNATKEGYSKKALEALTKGTYKQTREGSLAAYKKQQGRQNSPVVNNATMYQNRLNTEARKYQYNEAARKKNTLEKRTSVFSMKPSDHDYLQRIYDRFGDSDLTLRTLRESNRTKDWEKKYGKSYDQIYKDFLADQGNVKMEMGEKHPFLTEVGTIANSVPTALQAFPALLTNLADPENGTAKKYEQMRQKKSEENKYWRAGVKQNTGEKGDKVIDVVNNVADRMANVYAGNAVAPGLGAVMAGLSDANMQMDDLNLRDGVSGRKKAITALGHGAVEGIGTAITGGLLDMIPALNGVGSSLPEVLKTVGQSGLNVAKAGGNAAIENGISEAAEMGIDYLLNGENSQYGLNKALYEQQGMTEEEARKRASADQAKQVKNALGTGFLFGAGSKGISQALQLPSLIKDAKAADVDPVIKDATAQAEQAVDEINALRQQLPETPKAEPQIDPARSQAEAEFLRMMDAEYDNAELPTRPLTAAKAPIAENANALQNVDFKPSIHNADGQLLDTVKVPEYTADNDVFFNGSDADIAFADAQDAAITDTFRNIVSDPEFNALSFKNGRQEVYVSPSTSGNGYRMSYVIDGVPTGHHDYSLDEIGDLSKNLREMAGNGGEDIRIQRKSDLLRQTAEAENATANVPEAQTEAPKQQKPLPEGLITKQFEGEELENAKAEYNNNRKIIKALRDEIKIIEGNEKNYRNGKLIKSAQKEVDTRNARIKDIENTNKPLYRGIQGKQTPIKELIKDILGERAYNQIYDRKSGLDSHIGYASKFAGEQGKELAKQTRNALNKAIESGSDEDISAFWRSIEALDAAAKEVNETYRTKGFPEGITYADYFERESLPQMAGTNGLAGAFMLAKKRAAALNNTGIDSTPKITEAAEDVAPTVEPEMEAPVKPTENIVPEQTANEVPPEPGEEKIRSFSKRGSMDEELPEEIRNTLSEDMYRVVRNAETSARADELFDPNNLTQTRSNLKQAIDSHDPASALLSYKLAKAYVDAGEYDAATDVLEEVSAELTRMGQFTQAAKLAMMQNDPMAALRSYERDLQKLNQWGKKKYKKKWNDLKLDKEDIDLFNKVQKGDKEGLNEVVNQLNAKFGKKVPSTWWDKLVGATKTAMLLNFRTQSRNILANVATLPMRSASDRVSALGQNIVHLFNKDFEVNQSLLGGTKEQKKIAAQIFENSKNEIVGENKMKDSVKSDILSHKQTFNNDFLAKWIDNQTNGGIQKLNERLGQDANTSTMETLQNLTYWLMGDFGDTPFVKKNFVNRLASYMKAQGINNIEDVPDEAVAIATQEALKATFKDDNAFSKALQGVKQKTGKFGEVALPFVKTPANLTMRAVDYSPAGIINTIRKARSGAELNDVIDDLSKNLTGTALIYLGYKLAEKGIISGAYSADKDEASFQKQQGMLEYSFHIPDDVPVIGGNYYSYDWSQPASTPLVIGTTIYEAIKNSDKENNEIKDIVNGVYKGGLNVANTIINSSPLQSLSDILGSDGTDEGGVAGNVANEIMEFPQRLIPSILGATARTIDPTIRDTYVSDNTLTGTLGNQLRSAQAKIPFLSEMLPASYDTWGNERKRSDSVGEAFVAQMVNPGQVGNKNITPIDDEIQKIYDETGNAAVFPLNAARKLDLGSDGNITLTNKQHSDYQRLMGQTSYKFAESLINNEDFQSLSSDEKAATLESVYKLSNELAKEELFNHTTDSNKELKEIARTGDAEAVTQYLMDKQKAKSLDMDVRTYREKEAEQPGGAVQYAETKQEAVDNGFVTKDGNANVKQYEKVLEQAGQYSDKVLNDLPTLESSGLKPSAYYYYAKAVNVLPSLTPNEFATTYKAIDTNPDNAMTQKEVLAYLNKGNYTDQQANQLWLMYAPEGKKLPYLKKDGTWGAN